MLKIKTARWFVSSKLPRPSGAIPWLAKSLKRHRVTE